MKSLGFYEADMRRLFVMEGLAMGIGGSVLGAMLGALLTLRSGRSSLPTHKAMIRSKSA
jgi:lipoprotein-releasing system permease protein